MGQIRQRQEVLTENLNFFQDIVSVTDLCYPLMKIAGFYANEFG